MLVGVGVSMECSDSDTGWFLVIVVPASMGYYLTQIFVTRFLLL